MKKSIVAFVLVLSLISTAQAAPPDLSIYTYDQLIALQHYITMEIMNRPEWKEVSVPAGTWIVGVDIPEGEYSIYPSESWAYLKIIDNKGNTIRFGGMQDEEDVIGKVKLKEAYTVEIDGGALIFRPAIVLSF